jgi:uncharacterized membrane protein YhiD involved in acid resistance
MSVLGTLGSLGLAFVLCALVGLERELRQKSAGLRTHTLVGLSSAAIMLVSKFGFNDVLQPGRTVLDPSRVAAQIVSGIGFIGGGLIFVRRDAVRGLTTAAGVWLVAAVGMARGASLPLLAVALTGGHLIVSFGSRPIIRRLPRSRPGAWMGTGPSGRVMRGGAGRGASQPPLTIPRSGAPGRASRRSRGRRPAGPEPRRAAPRTAPRGP